MQCSLKFLGMARWLGAVSSTKPVYRRYVQLRSLCACPGRISGRTGKARVKCAIQGSKHYPIYY